MRHKFGALKTMATIFNVLGTIVLVVGILLAAITIGGLSLFGLEGFGTGVIAGIGVLAYALFGYLFLASFGQLILVLLAIEENTRRTAAKLSGEEDWTF